ncbi:MAG TPA: AMP-binding protein [Gemmatimonadaceae bacterium]|nr:AMP-binding protein [Gemmatimonadaceae bacterium]
MRTADATPVALSPNIAELLWRAAASDGERIAIATCHGETSFAALAARAAGFAAELRVRGIAPGDRVAIFLERTPDAAAAFFGTVAVGAIAVVIAETLRPRQIDYILQHADAKLLLTSADLLARLPRELAPTVPQLDVLDVAIASAWTPLPRIGTDIAQLIYTSGSTGFPKGVTISHANLWAGVQAVTRYLDLRASDRIASLLPFSFDYGLNQLLGALWSRATLVIERSRLADDIVAALRRQEVTVLAAVPPLWMQLLTASAFAEAIPTLRIMTSTGGRLPIDAVRRLRTSQPQARLFLMYGLTEAFRATYLPPDEVDAFPNSIGRAIPGADIMILKDDGTPCGDGEIGELVQRGPTVAVGYWNDPAATATTFRPNPCQVDGMPDHERVVFSGDLVRRDHAGRIFFIGRHDKLIKTLGHRVSPDEVTDALYASGEVAEAVVMAEPDGMRGEQIVAVVTLVPDGSVARLRAFCKTELPRYMQPARYQVEDALPRVSTGKYDVDAIRAQVAARSRE